MSASASRRQGPRVLFRLRARQVRDGGARSVPQWRRRHWDRGDQGGLHRHICQRRWSSRFPPAFGETLLARFHLISRVLVVFFFFFLMHCHGATRPSRIVFPCEKNNNNNFFVIG